VNSTNLRTKDWRFFSWIPTRRRGHEILEVLWSPLPTK
jgi:hypothetical protein